MRHETSEAPHTNQSEVAPAIEAGGVSPAGVRRIPGRQKGIRRGKGPEPQRIVRGQLVCTVQAGGRCRAFGAQTRTGVRNEGHIDDGGNPAAAQGGDGNHPGPAHVRLRTLVFTGGGGLRRQEIQETDLPTDGAPLPAAPRIHLPVPGQTCQRAERRGRQRLADADISADKGGCGEEFGEDTLGGRGHRPGRRDQAEGLCETRAATDTQDDRQPLRAVQHDFGGREQGRSDVHDLRRRHECRHLQGFHPAGHQGGWRSGDDDRGQPEGAPRELSGGLAEGTEDAGFVHARISAELFSRTQSGRVSQPGRQGRTGRAGAARRLKGRYRRRGGTSVGAQTDTRESAEPVQEDGSPLCGGGCPGRGLSITPINPGQHNSPPFFGGRRSHPFASARGVPSTISQHCLLGGIGGLSLRGSCPLGFSYFIFTPFNLSFFCR